MRDFLFEPIKINQLEIKNRINMPAMNLNYCDQYQVTDKLVNFYAERAKGGVGMLTTGCATVDEYSGGVHFMGAHKDEFVPGLRRVATAVRDNGAAAFIQLNHLGRYAFSKDIGKRQPLAPSAVASRLTRETPHALTPEEIDQVIDAFAQAARRVKEAGFDGLEVLCGTGYLISEFLSPLTNQRTDGYGGSLENRMRFGLEIIGAIRKMVGDNYPIVVRMNGNDFMPGGNNRKELQAFAKALVAESVDALNINVGWHEARVPQVVTAVPRGVYAFMARDIKALVNVPVMTGHRINDPNTARELIGNGMCDMVCMGRPLIADPYLPQKAQGRKEKEIVHCVACGQGCFDHVFMVEHPVECLCNPKAGREAECRITPSKQPLRVMVVGGGAAGMSAALSAAECGHSVTLYEESDTLGGQLFLAGSPPGREEFVELAHDLAKQVAVAGIRVLLNQPVDIALIEKESPDAVILATGAKPLTPPVPGINLPHVVQAWDVLTNKVATGKRVVVVGGGAVGLETALFLAEKGTLSGDAVKFLLVNRAEDPETLYQLATKGSKEIVLIEMIAAIGKDVGLTTRWTFMQDIDRAGVTLLNNTKALEITPTGVKVEKGGEISEIPCDSVVIAAGAKSYNPLQEILQKKGIPCQVVGDAGKIGLALHAIHQGFEAGRNVAK
ncbi:MAG: FAD-dependent oxidoreductase [Desulfobacterales bacterium]|nr:FAD-dependent oxidoreductase [Desulfobacterales bacterium]